MSGTIYLLHFSAPGPGGARHYIGWSADLAGRLHAHLVGRGSRLMAAIRRLGIDWRCVASWPGDRAEERRLHLRHQHARLCPVCRRLALACHAAHERSARAAGRRRRRRGVSAA
jgi:hypothetical protein